MIKNDLENFESLSMNYNYLRDASIVKHMKHLRILYLEGNDLKHVPTFHASNDVSGFRLDLRWEFSNFQIFCGSNFLMHNFSGNKIKEILKNELTRKSAPSSDDNSHKRSFYGQIDLSGKLQTVCFQSNWLLSYKHCYSCKIILKFKIQKTRLRKFIVMLLIG